MSTNTNNRTTQQLSVQKLIDGLNKHSQTIASLVIGGTSLTTAAIIANLQERLATANAAQSTRATWQNAVKADKDERAKMKTFLSGLRQALSVAFAGSIEALADFGLVARKKPVITPEKKAAATAKAKATREARHTMGKNQKAAIKGTVSPTAPATAAPTAPAPTVPAATTVSAPPLSPASPTVPAAPVVSTPPTPPASPAPQPKP
jgi:hypothetical protein